MKGLKSLQIKAEAYLKPKRAYMTKLFMKIVNDLLFSQKIFIIDARLGSKEVSENKEIFKTKLGGGVNHRDSYIAERFLFPLALEPEFFLYIVNQHK